LSRFERKVGDPVDAPALIRRQWLRAFVGLFGVLSLGPPSLVLHEASSNEANLEKWLKWFVTNYPGDGAALSQLGTVYLKSNPRERNRIRLSRLLSANSASLVPQSLIGSIARDWVEHDVTLVDGWVVARTEARICGLLHLLGEVRV
jgi:hypothetical protein